MDCGPVSTFQVHEYIRPDLFYLYQNDYLTDQFQCCLSGNGQRVATGSYSLFRVFGTAEGSTEATFVEASKNPMRRRGQTPSRPSRSPVVRRGAQSRVLEADEDSINYNAKLQHLAWHPSENIIACSGADSLFMFYA
uniref:Anaphase-promoting complex subunit 4 WD40 domain-containing protein n=2 Tax=Daucus carota subsp. sativus TaxID=79200 RepID=A0A164XAQ1_DAUCS